MTFNKVVTIYSEFGFNYHSGNDQAWQMYTNTLKCPYRLSNCGIFKSLRNKNCSFVFSKQIDTSYNGFIKLMIDSYILKYDAFLSLKIDLIHANSTEDSDNLIHHFLPK